MRIFVSFWATFEGNPLSDSFVGNGEFDVPNGINGIDDINELEMSIKNELNEDVDEGMAKVDAISIINWKAF